MKLGLILAIAKKDLRMEFRAKHTINFMLLFSLLTIIVFSVALGPSNIVEEVGSGLLWMIFLFTGMMGISRAFIREKELGTLDGIRLSPVDPESLLIGKILYNLLLMLFIEALIFPLFIIMLNYQVVGNPLSAFFVLTMGLFGFVIVCSALSALVLNARTRELLLPVILFPIIFPIISISIHALKEVLGGAGILDVGNDLVFIAAYMVIMLTVSILTFRFALED
ncbi:MAG: heme exporter protein CcmB [Halobacteriota archaeon]|nr:heme exporter protein CcmB [Halobacteriota archaeon]